MNGNFFCHICGGLVDLIKLQPPGVRFCECNKRFDQLRAENERLKAEFAEVNKDAERLKGLRELCGYVEDGSSQTIRITQDDATNNWIIRWNDKAGWVFSSSFNGAIDAAMKGK